MRYLALTALLFAGPALAAPPAPSETAQVQTPENTPRKSARTFDELEHDGLMAMGRGDRERALELFLEAHALRPDRKTPVQRLCSIYKAMNQPEKAIDHCLAWRDREHDSFVRAMVEKTVLDMRAAIRAKAAD